MRARNGKSGRGLFSLLARVHEKNLLPVIFVFLTMVMSIRCGLCVVFSLYLVLHNYFVLWLLTIRTRVCNVWFRAVRVVCVCFYAYVYGLRKRSTFFSASIAEWFLRESVVGSRYFSKFFFGV